MAFWRWFSLSQGGICQFPGGYRTMTSAFRRHLNAKTSGVLTGLTVWCEKPRTDLLRALSRGCFLLGLMSAREKKTSDILEQLHRYTRTLILDDTIISIMKLSGTIGVTQKNDDFWYASLPDFIANMKNPQERWGTHKRRWPFQPCPLADVEGLGCCSYGCSAYHYKSFRLHVLDGSQ